MNPLYKNKTVFAISLVIVVTGLISMVTICLNNNGVETWFDKYVGLRFNNVLCITLVGFYYLLFQFKKNGNKGIFFYVLSSAITIISLLTLAEYIFNIKTGIDQLFVTDKLDIVHHNPFPGRITPQVAAIFLLFGLSLLGFSTSNRVAHILSQYALHAVSLITATLLIGFLYSDSLFNNIKIYGLNYLFEGMLVFIMSITGTLLHPSLGVTGLFSGNLVGNKMARRLFVLMTIVIFVFGAIKAKFLGFQLWQFDTNLSLFITSVIVVGLLVIWYVANWLNRIDLKRYDAENKLKSLNEELEKRVERRTTDLKEVIEKLGESELKFRTIAEKSLVGVYISQKERFTYVNPRFAEIFGYAPGELINTTQSAINMIISEEGQKTVRENILARYKGEIDNAHYEVKGLRKDGTNNYVEFFGSRVTIDGQPSIIGTMLDITERKRAEEELRLSELKYKMLFKSNPQPLWMIAKDDLSIISVNDAAAKLYGYTKEELLLKNVAIFRPPEDLDKLPEIFQKDFSTSSDLGVVRHVKKDGSIIFAHIIANDIIFEGRKVRLSLTTDVTERVMAEENLQKSEANLRTILETTGTAYALLDKELNIIAFNKVAVKFVNNQFASFPQNAGKLTDFFPAEKFPQFRAYATEVLTGKNISYEVNYPQADGPGFFFSVRMFPIKNSEDEIFGMVLEISDITEIKKYTNAIEAQNEKLREIAWLQSHIVRAPLARIMGIVNLLKDNNLEMTEHHQFLEYLSSSADELDVIIRDITDRTVAMR